MTMDWMTKVNIRSLVNLEKEGIIKGNDKNEIIKINKNLCFNFNCKERGVKHANNHKNK